MKLNTLRLIQFKNYQETKVDFSEGINCFLGKNGMGKTNLLDALYYLSMTRSAFNTIDQQNIMHGEKYFAINSEFENDHDSVKVNCYYEQGKKKIIKVNGVEQEKFSDHIGTIPCVLISPDDTEIIREGSEIRRKLFDSVVSQYDRDYLNNLMMVQRLLKQRNSFLKENDGKLSINRRLLEVYDEKLLPVFKEIATAREQFIKQFEPYFADNYHQIFEGSEYPEIVFKSEVLNDDFEEEYHEAFQKDLILQRTTMGVHKDDYVFKLNERPIKKFGSQGQQKSFIIALKLAEYDFLKAIKKFNPMLLLDDIFDKLDDERISRLVKLLGDRNRFTQIFITDARAERTRQFFGEKDQVHFYEIANGTIQ